MKKFLTGITVTFNSSHVIDRLLLSIRKIIDDEIEWIIVDSGSRDKTRDILKNEERLKLFSFDRNIGFSRANNFAFKNSLGEYVFFCNPDIYFDKKNFEEILKELKEIKPRILVPLLKEEEGVRYFMRPLPSIRNILEGRWNRGVIKKGERIQPAFSAIFIQRKIFEELKGFDERFFVYFTDVEFFRRFYKKGYDTKDIYFSKNFVYHGKGSVPDSTKYSFLKKSELARGFIRYFLTHGSFIEKIFSFPFFILLSIRAFYFYLK